MVTFTVDGKEGKTYRYSKTERGHVFGSLLNAEGKAGKGRPSKFAENLVHLSEPVVVAQEIKTENPVSELKLVDLGTPVDPFTVPDADEGTVAQPDSNTWINLD